LLRPGMGALRDPVELCRAVLDLHPLHEVSRGVFTILARKARLLGLKTIFCGWHCPTARNAAANALAIQRRHHHNSAAPWAVFPVIPR
jgi:hypothetical protein